MEEKNYKREYRQMDDETKAKISQSLKNRGKSSTHAQNISNGMKDYWKSVPNKPSNNGSSPTETGEVI